MKRMKRIFLVFIIGFFLILGWLFESGKVVELFSPQGIINPDKLTGSYQVNVAQAIFNNQELSLPLDLAKSLFKKSRVLGENYGNKRIEIDLTNQRLYAFEDSRLVYNFLISSGKWGRTPTGHFTIWVKLRYTKMEGGSQALNTYYYLPNVPYVMFFYNQDIPKYRGFGIHGTYWHSNFGQPMSHGCINMNTEEAAQLYYWAQPELGNKSSIFADFENPGTPVVIYGVSPAG
ncbi:L,D-transpeptidase [Patescibacteria group bacterium]|nr:L,D-transpeptidase [Patescibacteria group bacterium]